MTEKKRSSKTSRLKNFLVTGTIEDEEGHWDISEGEEPREDGMESVMSSSAEGPPEEEVIIEDIVIETATAEPVREDTPYRAASTWADAGSLTEEIAELKEMVAVLTSELGKYTTSKEQLREYSTVMNKRDAELANRKFIGMLEQLSIMREDFFKLCKGMNAKMDSFSPKDILSSFEAYGVDMENILVDCGVQIGQSKYERLNTIHQRIVGVIPTSDESMNGMIAERVSDGYVYQGRVLQKEKVKIYKFSENKIREGDEEK
ncbi:MAG: nucleotide exchange factor GrpE [Methanomassiliicoccaceae archaeon]|nr:nucleotide exchange factor GrpE [Methanomassiliicoccaceae archaeon]MCL2145915.1 nucleotide exchange factor GrpE [Methanomassiliicoccaceae archaeon]